MILISLFLVLFSGYLLSGSFCKDLPSEERLSLSFPIGIALTTWSIWLALAFKVSISPIPFLFFQALLSLLLLQLNSKTSLFLKTNIKLSVNIPLLLIGTLILFSLIFNFIFPVLVPDGVYYKALGKVVIQEGEIMAFRNRTVIPDQNRTLGFHMISSYWQLFGSDYHKLTQTFLYTSLLGLFYSLIRRFLTKRHSVAFLLLLATAPMVWWHSFLYLNNLQAGIYFFAANTYWFIAYRDKKLNLLFLASFLFMCAQWTRYELSVIFCATLAVSIFFSIKESNPKWVWNLLSFPLFFSGLWAGYSYIFYPEQKQTIQFAVLFLFLASFIFIAPLAIRFKSLLFRAWPGMLFFIPIIYFLGVTGIFGLEKGVIISNIVWAKTINNALCQSVWGLGILLTLLIPFYYSNFDPLEKAMFFNFLGIFVGFTLLFSALVKGHPMIDQSTWQRILFFFQNPGQIAVRTSSREFFILFPTLLLFLGIMILGEKNKQGLLLKLFNIFDSKAIWSPIKILVFSNLIVITFFFLWPRIDFLTTQWNFNRDDILISQGPQDIPNLHLDTYIIARAASKKTPDKSVLYFPDPIAALSFRDKPYDSIGVFMAMDLLYPRHVVWTQNEQEIPSDAKNYPKFQVAFDGWELDQCPKKSAKKSLEHHGWYVCELKR